MRKLIISTFLTLDGVMQAPGGPGEDDDGEFAHGGWSVNDATKYVASRSRPTLEWTNSVLIEGDAAEGIAALKAEDGPELQVHGSGDLIQTLLRHNLVDEYRLWVFPLVIGSGRRLFSDGTMPSGLKLVDSVVSTTGVVMGRYEPAGDIVTGSFALD